ncbi:hypothetical protein K9N68_04550 [Kovacikia minuta CCNUW1]|uniref:hypothetical protein n=1 Tax=Kovacikia minuta TaxID=2931930 RepID=UPI001CC8F835|nr:hypothetical protein [Kovacikia minuta]UBF27240.1 hypothetical protein K9N68_04550 [Kovacikia minuta CCNUW1]
MHPPIAASIVILNISPSFEEEYFKPTASQFARPLLVCNCRTARVKVLQQYDRPFSLTWAKCAIAFWRHQLLPVERFRQHALAQVHGCET